MAVNNADFGCTFTIRSAGNQPYDLTGAALEMSIKNKAGATAAAMFSTTGGQLVIQSPATAGIVTLYVPFATMAALSAGVYYWDLLQLVSSDSRVFLGGGTWQITQGITESTTPSLPVPSPYLAAPGSDIALAVGNQSLVLSLAPGGPPGSGTNYQPQSVPGPPASGFLVYCDQADNWLKAISANGTITDLAPP